MITKQELLQGRDISHASEYSQEISDNLDQLLEVLNKVRAEYGKPIIVNSGWRPPSINSQTPGAATNSAHCLGLAVDFKDDDGSIMKWVLNNLQLMKDLGIYLEDFRWTNTWTHMGLVVPKSKNRIFVPNATRAVAPNRWSGTYDKKYDGKES